MQSVFPTPSRPAGSRCRARLLRRAAFGIAGTGWALFAASALGDSIKPGIMPISPPEFAFDNRTWRVTLRNRPEVLGPGRASHPRQRSSAASAAKFTLDLQERLPRYQALFQMAGQRSGLDWRLLAAVGYQESNWNPRLVSPTGVRGIMMLTLDTADEMEVDREDPSDCIHGGALYLQQIRQRLPEQIHEPDRTWMALAAYNQGMAHLQDARRLAARLGGSPNRWQNVRAALPLLAQERYYSESRYGYFPGMDAVNYVGNVREYYERLLAYTSDPKLIQVASSGS